MHGGILTNNTRRNAVGRIIVRVEAIDEADARYAGGVQ